MKGFITKLTTLTLALSFVLSLGITLIPQTANAETWAECVANPFRLSDAECAKLPGAPKEIPGKCGMFNMSQCIIDAVLIIPAKGALLMLKLAQWLTHLSGMILNFVVDYTIVKMKEKVSNADAVGKAWKTIRDIGNMGFIFVLLYAAILTIIGQGSDNQKLIVKVVVVAILINFSLFFTKVVIDISNMLALTFYDAIAPGAAGKSLTQGLSASLMEPLKLQSIFEATGGGIDGEKLLVIGVAGTIFALIAAFILFAIAIMFVIRFVVLIFVMILSPLAFLSFVLPEMDKYRNQWKEALIGQAFFAPIYFMLTWVVIVVSRSLLSNNGSFANIAGTTGPNGSNVAPDGSTVALIVNFIIVIAMLVISLVIAKDWANKAPGGISKLTNWATAAAGGATLGAVGGLGRATIGRAADTRANNQDLKDRASQKGWAGMTARMELGAARKAAGSTFDFRGSKVGEATLGMTGAGKAGGKGGFTEYKKKKAEEEAKYAASLAPGDEVINIAEQDLKRAKEQEKEIRNDAVQNVDQTHTKPEILQQLERNIRAAEVIAKNPNLSERSRNAAAQRLIVLKEQAKPIQEAHERKRQQKIDNIVSSSGIQSKVSAAKQEVDSLKGVKPEEASNMKAEIVRKSNQEIANDPTIKAAKIAQESAKKREADLINNDPILKKEKELEEEVKEKSEELANTTIPQLQSQRKWELETKKQELEVAKKASEARRKIIEKNIEGIKADVVRAQEAANLRRTAIERDTKAKVDAISPIESAGDRRKKAYADNIEESSWAYFRGYNTAAAAQIRKGKSKEKKLMEDIEKLYKKGEEDKKDDETPSKTEGEEPKTT